MITCEGKHLLTAKEKEHFEGMIHIMKRIGSINKKILLHEDVSKAEFFTLMSIHRIVSGIRFLRTLEWHPD